MEWAAFLSLLLEMIPVFCPRSMCCCQCWLSCASCLCCLAKDKCPARLRCWRPQRVRVSSAKIQLLQIWTKRKTKHDRPSARRVCGTRATARASWRVTDMLDTAFSLGKWDREVFPKTVKSIKKHGVTVKPFLWFPYRLWSSLQRMTSSLAGIVRNSERNQ